MRTSAVVCSDLECYSQACMLLIQCLGAACLQGAPCNGTEARAEGLTSKVSKKLSSLSKKHQVQYVA